MLSCKVGLGLGSGAQEAYPGTLGSCHLCSSTAGWESVSVFYLRRAYHSLVKIIILENRRAFDNPSHGAQTQKVYEYI